MTSNSASPLSSRDLHQLREAGIAPSEALRQLRLLKEPPEAIVLQRPCRAGDGIRVLEAAESEPLVALAENARRAGRLSKFVPASGQASRMFQFLTVLRARDVPLTREAITTAAAGGQPDAQEAFAFVEGFGRFAFLAELSAVMLRKGYDALTLARQGRYAEIVEFLLGPRGLGYESLPKGLIKFHRCDDGVRTAFEEHLAEGAGYVSDARGKTRIHYTVSKEHLALFKAHAAKAVPSLQRRLRCRFELGFSVQKPSTQTLALGEGGAPARQNDGSLLLRAGGHGALIENLNDLSGDIVFIKNIDNVVPDPLKEEGARWKKILAGCLLETQNGVFERLQRLRKHPADTAALNEALGFAEKRFGAKPPASVKRASRQERYRYAVALLDRPLRVCGMVYNRGEPGGGPFWVKGPAGELTPQIVEGAQVSVHAKLQQAVFASSTHFNPVDMMCAVRNSEGKPHDLRKFVDASAVIVSQKPHLGRMVRALERPGLWNGGMARWNTLFVEVPASTFQPVKTVNDLLRPAHQA